MAETRVACLLADGFEDSEFRVPYDTLKQAGIGVDIISGSAGQQLRGERGKEHVKADVSIDQVKPESYQALLIPGGFSPDRLRADGRFVEFVKKFDSLGRPVAAVCHGPQLLMAARLVKGRTLTAWKTVREDLELAGVRTKDEPVVRDGNWITSRQPSDLPAFSEALLRTLQ
ncbi:MAG TPA: type 1 glutamine amidotransferase domain-containing protein [Myxococcales bacterium]|jgi:protease I